jgi:hypothetical protein
MAQLLPMQQGLPVVFVPLVVGLLAPVLLLLQAWFAVQALVLVLLVVEGQQRQQVVGEQLA